MRDVPISVAVAASSAIPGFFEPYEIGGRHYVDGGVGFTGHADLAAAGGADIIFVVHPLVPSIPDEADASVGSRGLYTIMEQTNRIYGQSLLHLGLSKLSTAFPKTSFFLLEPARARTPLFGPTLGFGAARAALRYGYTSTKEWLGAQGLPLLEKLLPEDRRLRASKRIA